MILFPAIDIKSGFCVRLVQGNMENVTIFNKDPLDQAKIFESKGCKWIHIVDLDGAIKGKSINKKIIKKIISSVNLKIQLGGGIRNMDTLELYKSYGAQHFSISTLIINPFLFGIFYSDYLHMIFKK